MIRINIEADQNFPGLVKYQCLEMPEHLRGKEKLFEHGDISIYSVEAPELRSSRIYLMGDAKLEDNNMCILQLKSLEKAEEYVAKVKCAIKRYNAELNNHYYFITYDGYISRGTKGTKVHAYHVRTNNAWETEEECRKAIEVRAIVDNFRWHIGPEELHDTSLPKFYIVSSERGLRIDECRRHAFCHIMFMAKNEAEKVLESITHEEWDKYILGVK